MAMAQAMQAFMDALGPKVNEDYVTVNSVRPTSVDRGALSSSVVDAVVSKVDPGKSTAAAVKNPDGLDPKRSDEERRKMTLAARALRAMAPRVMSGKGRQNEIKTILNYTNTFSTTAATDDKTVITLTLSNSTEWTSLIALWDEVIVDGGHFDFTSSVTTGFTTNNGALRAVVAFDPMDATSLGSLSNGMQHSQHLQFQSNNSAAVTTVSPVCISSKGYHRLRFKVPRGSVRSSGSSAIFGHEWSSTGDASDSYGYIKFYIPSTGATGVYTIYWTWTLNCRFRCRT